MNLVIKLLIPIFLLSGGWSAAVAAGISLGVYFDGADTNEIAAFYDEVGKQHAIVAYALLWDAPASSHTTLMNWVREAGATPLCIWGRGSYGELSYQEVADGGADEVLEPIAEAVAAFGDQVLFTLDMEFNHQGNPSCYLNDPSGDASGFGTMWRHVHEVFHAAGADNVQWAWVPNYQSVPNNEANNYNNYYPGHAYVDWVGTLGFDCNWDWNNPGSANMSFQSLFNSVLSDLANRYPAKPQIVAWFGTAGDASTKQSWIANGYSAMSNYPNLRAVCWYNDFSGGAEGFDFRVTTTARYPGDPVPVSVSSAYAEAISPSFFLSTLPPYDSIVPGGSGSSGAFTIALSPDNIDKGEAFTVNWAFSGIAQRVDAYLGVKLPNGKLLVMNSKLGFGADIVPVVRDFDVSGNPNGTLNLKAPPGISGGNYTFKAVCVAAGEPVTNAGNWLGSGMGEAVLTIN
jgi:hypothetical protein